MRRAPSSPSRRGDGPGGETMRLVRGLVDGGPVYGELVGTVFWCLPDAPFSLPPQRTSSRPVADVQLGPPARPSKILAVAGGFSADVEPSTERGVPFLFLEAPSSLVGDGEAIVYPPILHDHLVAEGELALVIGSVC